MTEWDNVWSRDLEDKFFIHVDSMRTELNRLAKTLEEKEKHCQELEQSVAKLKEAGQVIIDESDKRFQQMQKMSAELNAAEDLRRLVDAWQVAYTSHMHCKSHEEYMRTRNALTLAEQDLQNA